jgi:hypothetical protein
MRRELSCLEKPPARSCAAVRKFMVTRRHIHAGTAAVIGPSFELMTSCMLLATPQPDMTSALVVLPRFLKVSALKPNKKVLRHQWV